MKDFLWFSLSFKKKKKAVLRKKKYFCAVIINGRKRY
jgi:hypothetical protein